MKRALLIAGGTIGGLGAVMAITPPQFSTTNSAGIGASKSTTLTSTKTTEVIAPKGVTGTFVGPLVYVNYGNVQVEITVKDGKITDAKALQAPNGRSQRWTDMATPILRQQTLAAQSASIQGASGASYTSNGWYKSLQGALAKAGL